MEPTGGAMDISLSLRITVSCLAPSAGVVHGLVSHARAHRAVADNRHDAVVLALGVTRGGEAHGGRDGGGGVGGAEGVVFAFGPAW